MINKLIKNIREDLNKISNPKLKETSQRFFKEKILCYGTKTSDVVKIAKKYWKEEVLKLSKEEIFKICEELYASNYSEEAYIVSEWVPNLKDQFVKTDIKIFKKWIDTYINDWAKCDSFCNHTMGDFIEKFPEYIEELKSWTKSKNKWMRRASAVSLILPARRGKYLKDIFEISDVLLLDKEDMVQKGYGWLLKEASRLHQKEVFDYVVKNRAVMPRTALRYAIEKMPENLRKEAMRK